MLAIYRVSAIPGEAIQVSVSDKLLHTIEYAGLSFFLYIALHFGLNLHPRRAAWLAIVLSALFGAGDEIHQSFVPSRDMSIYDWYADVFGAVLAQLGLFVLRIGWKRNISPPHT